MKQRPPLQLDVVAIEKEAFGSPSTTVAYFTLLPYIIMILLHQKSQAMNEIISLLFFYENGVCIEYHVKDDVPLNKRNKPFHINSVWPSEAGGFFLSSAALDGLWHSGKPTWRGLLLGGLRTKIGQSAVPAWTQVKLRESPRLEIGSARTKEIGQLRLRLGSKESRC